MRKGVPSKGGQVSKKGAKGGKPPAPVKHTRFAFEKPGDQFFADSTERPLLEITCEPDDRDGSSSSSVELSFITFNEMGKKQDALSLAKRASWQSPVLVARTGGGTSTTFTVRLNELVDRGIAAFSLMGTVNQPKDGKLSTPRLSGESLGASAAGSPRALSSPSNGLALPRLGSKSKFAGAVAQIPFRFKVGAPASQDHFLSAASGQASALVSPSSSSQGRISPGTPGIGGSSTARRPPKLEPVYTELVSGSFEIPETNNSSVTFLTGRHVPETDLWTLMLVTEHLSGKTTRLRSFELEALARKVVLGWCPTTQEIRFGGKVPQEPLDLSGMAFSPVFGNGDVFEDQLGKFPEGFFDDCDTQSTSSGEEVRYVFPRPKFYGKRPRVVRQTKKHYSTGRAVGAKPKNNLGLWALKEGQKHEGSDASSDDDPEEDQSDLAVKLPMFESRLMIRYENSCYNQGSKRVQLVNHLVSKAREYDSPGGPDKNPEDFDGGEVDDDTPPHTPTLGPGADTPSKRLSMADASPDGSNVAATLDGSVLNSELSATQGPKDNEIELALPPIAKKQKTPSIDRDGSDAESRKTSVGGSPPASPIHEHYHVPSSAVPTPQAPSSPPPPVSAARKKKKALQRDPLGYIGQGELQTWLNKLVVGGPGAGIGGGGLPPVPKRKGAKGPVPGRKPHRQ